MTTIDVYGKYVIHANQDLSFDNETAFTLSQVGSDVPQVVNFGSVAVSGDQDGGQLIGVTSDYESQEIGVWNRAGASFTVTETGVGAVAGGFDFEADGLMRNDGEVVISSSQGDAYGFAGNTFQPQFVNTGHFEVDAAITATGVFLDDDGDVDNSGEIDVSGGVNAVGVSMNEEDNFTNSGTINVLGGSSAVGVTFDFFRYTFANTGTISVAVTDGSASSVALEISAFADYGFNPDIENSGVLRGDYAIRELASGYADGMRDLVDNSGSMVGIVDLGFLDDQLFNSGKIRGDVLLGQGDDLYQADGHGKLHGSLYGGIGDDTLVGGQGHDVIFGDDGTDGGGDGEDLLSGGKGDDALDGNDGADTLIGGAGSDTLTGGYGKDSFQFHAIGDSTPGHADLITDLGKADIIDLSQIDADTTQHGDQAFHLVAQLDGHAGEASLSYDSASGLTILSLDVDGDGTADAVITMTGDHSAFTNFVL